MLSRSLYVFPFAFLLNLRTAVYASEAQQSILVDHAGRSGQVKSVLEHEPVSEPACKQFVSNHFRVPS